MWGVLTAYELQVIHDWIRGDASADGRPYTQAATYVLTSIRPSCEVAARQTRGDKGSSDSSQHTKTVEPVNEDLLL